MKKLTRFLLIAGLLVLPLCANASIIGDVNLTLDASNPTGYVKIFGVSENVYLDYDAKLTGDTSYREAFCVENASAVDGSTNLYTLLTVDSGLSAYGLDPVKYLRAVVVADYFYNNYLTNDAYKAGAQLVIWELLFETDGSFNFNSGNFQAFSNNNAYVDEATAIWNAIQNMIASTSTDEWVLAVNPTVDEGQTVAIAAAQNYLVKYDVPQVPEPASLLLFGLGLLGLAGVGRKMKK